MKSGSNASPLTRALEPLSPLTKPLRALRPNMFTQHELNQDSFGLRPGKTGRVHSGDNGCSRFPRCRRGY
ncbi:hypothetical protein BRAS3843_140018 [Bradyrhizobium sp. STM 3843]|nr:hypothetical protein BRAS3843_140018 [Bradyrhizobium sp. STM 3843]